MFTTWTSRDQFSRSTSAPVRETAGPDRSRGVRPVQGGQISPGGLALSRGVRPVQGGLDQSRRASPGFIPRLLSYDRPEFGGGGGGGGGGGAGMWCVCVYMFCMLACVGLQTHGHVLRFLTTSSSPSSDGSANVILGRPNVITLNN